MSDIINNLEQQIASQGAPVAASEPSESLESTETPPVEQEVDNHESDDAQEESAASESKTGTGKRLTAQERLKQVLEERKSDRRALKAREEEAEFWRRKALESTIPAKQEKVSVNEPKTLADFGNNAEAYLDHIAELKAQAAVQKLQKDQMTQAEKARIDQREKAYNERVAAYEAAHPDVDYHEEVTRANLPISVPMAEFLKESDHGPALGVYFRDNPKEAEKIYAMNPRDADRAMARIEAKIGSESPSKPVQITRAPPAPPRLNASAAAGKAASTMQDEIAAVRARLQS